MREEIKQLHYSLDNRQSIHVEMTLAGRGKAQLNLIDKAHENGFEVTLLYVALRDENLAIKRVEDRVQKGGHGVPSEIIKNDLIHFPWINQNINCSENVQKQLKNFLQIITQKLS